MKCYGKNFDLKNGELVIMKNIQIIPAEGIIIPVYYTKILGLCEHISYCGLTECHQVISAYFYIDEETNKISFCLVYYDGGIHVVYDKQFKIDKDEAMMLCNISKSKSKVS